MIKWVTGLNPLLIGVVTPFVTGMAPPFRCILDWLRLLRLPSTFLLPKFGELVWGIGGLMLNVVDVVIGGIGGAVVVDDDDVVVVVVDGHVVVVAVAWCWCCCWLLLAFAGPDLSGDMFFFFFFFFCVSTPIWLGKMLVVTWAVSSGLYHPLLLFFSYWKMAQYESSLAHNQYNALGFGCCLIKNLWLTRILPPKTTKGKHRNHFARYLRLHWPGVCRAYLNTTRGPSPWLQGEVANARHTTTPNLPRDYGNLINCQNFQAIGYMIYNINRYISF